MNNHIKIKEHRNGGNMTLREKATAVFRKVGDGIYEATKARHGDILLGGKYDYQFVKIYAANNINVFIEGDA